MKKTTFLGLAAALGTCSALTTGVFATTTATVDDFAGLKSCLEQTAATCTLTANITAESPITVAGNATLNLGTFTISVADSGLGAGNDGVGIITVNHGAELTINGSADGKITTGESGVYTAIRMTSETNDALKAKLTVNGGTLEGKYYGIVGNGSAKRGNTEIIINDGLIQGMNEGDNFGIYHPQAGTLTMNGGLVEGNSGIALKAGSFILNGGIVSATGTGHDPVEGYSNGVNPSGAALQIESNKSYAGKISFTLNGGQLKSADGYGLYEYIAAGTNGTSVVSLRAVEGSISGGKRFAMVSSSELDPTAASHVADGSVYELSEDKKIATYRKVSAVKDLPEDLITETKQIAGVDKLDGKEKTALDSVKIAGLKTYNLFDISVLNKATSSSLSETPEAISFTFDIPTELQTPAKGYLRTFHVIRLHYEDDETTVSAEELETTISEDGKTLTFKSDKFSTYVFGYSDVKNPETGSTLASTAIVAAVALFTACGAGALALNKR